VMVSCVGSPEAVVMAGIYTAWPRLRVRDHGSAVDTLNLAFPQ
jgi:hypothetical protein